MGFAIPDRMLVESIVVLSEVLACGACGEKRGQVLGSVVDFKLLASCLVLMMEFNLPA